MKNKCSLFLLLGTLLAMFLPACNTAPTATPRVSPLVSPVQTSPLAPEAASNEPIAPVDAPEPLPGKASISGALYSYSSQVPIPGTLLYLTSAVGPNNQMPSILIGPQEDKGDIIGKSDDKSQFSLNNIPPGNYYLIVSSSYNWPEADVSATDHRPRLIQLKANQKEPLGIVYVGWP